jgi:hypothetical protein
MPDWSEFEAVEEPKPSPVDWSQFEPTDQPKVSLSPYDKYRLSGGETVAGPFGPANPQEVLGLKDVLKIPAAIIGPALDKTGIMQSFEEAGANALQRTGINPGAQPGESFLPKREEETIIPTPFEEAFPNVGRGLEEGVKSLFTPGNAMVAPFGVLKPVQAAFEAQMGSGVPESVEGAITAPTPEERAKASLQAALGLVAGGHGLRRFAKSPEAPLAAQEPPSEPLSAVEAPKVAETPSETVQTPPDLNSLQRTKGKYQTGIQLKNGTLITQSDLFSPEEIKTAGDDLDAITHDKLEMRAVQNKELGINDLVGSRRVFVKNGKPFTLTEVAREEMKTPPAALTEGDLQQAPSEVTAKGGEAATSPSELESKGVSREEIYKQTGMWKGPGGFWLSDTASAKVPDDFAQRYFRDVKEKNPQPVRGYTFGELVGEDAPVFSDHPELKNMKVYVDLQSHGAGGSFAANVGRDQQGWIHINIPTEPVYDPTTKSTSWVHKTVKVNPDIEAGEGKYTKVNENPSDLVSRVLTHEINHAIQQKLGLPEGGSPLDYFLDKGEKYSEESYGTKGKDYYKSLAGEALSRLSEERAKMTEAQRKAEPPWETFDKMLNKEGIKASDLTVKVKGKVVRPISPPEPAKAEVSTPEPNPQASTVTEPVTEPAIEGMGGAALGELPDTGAGGEKYGVAERVRAERAQAGQVDPVEPGVGTSPEAQVLKYREIVAADPTAGPKALEAFEADPKKQISAELEGVTRAHGEALFSEARKIEGKFGTDSKEYRDAYKVASDWDKRTKPIQTAWSEIGRGQQGETDLDTGSFTGLRREREKTGKDFTPEQKPKAERIAADNRVAQGELDKADGRLTQRISKIAKVQPENAKVWELAKKYLDENKGLYGFDDVRNKIATDLGMTPEQVTKVLAADSVTKKLSVDLWNKQRNARRLKEQAKNWLRELDTPGYRKALASIPRWMFSLATFGHGFVALGTHAPIVAFQPRFWNAYVRNFGKMYKMVFSPTYYESQMQDLVRRPNYELARRSGLQNDPFKYEEYHTGEIKNLVKDWIGEKNMDRIDKLASAGNRGYGVLKLLRQDMFDQRYNKLPDSVRSAEGMTAGMSDDINHATGVTKKGAPQGLNVLLFAPRLAGSRVMWAFGDPLRAAGTIANWDHSTTAEKQFAVNQMKEKAWVAGTFASLLAMNQGFLSATGSKQKINGIPESMGGAGFDPMASDFMKFKAAGGNIAYGGALLTMAKLPARVATAILYEGKGSKYILEDERVDKVIGQYVRSQASPFAGTVADLALGRDYEERPLPAKMFGLAEQNGKVPKRLQEQGVDEPYNWAEFAATKLPIPVAEGIKEGLKGSGMSDEQAAYWMKAWAITSIMTATGTRITEDTREE